MTFDFLPTNATTILTTTVTKNTTHTICGKLFFVIVVPSWLVSFWSPPSLFRTILHHDGHEEHDAQLFFHGLSS